MITRVVIIENPVFHRNTEKSGISTFKIKMQMIMFQYLHIVDTDDGNSVFLY